MALNAEYKCPWWSDSKQRNLLSIAIGRHRKPVLAGQPRRAPPVDGTFYRAIR